MATFGCLAVGCGLSVSGRAAVESGRDAAVDSESPGLDAAPDVDADASTAVAPPEFAWYKLNETSGNVAHDSTPNGYDVRLDNVTWSSGAIFSAANSPSGGAANVAAGLREAPVSFAAWLTSTARIDETSNAHAITPYPPNAVSGDAPGAFGFGIGLNVWNDGAGGSALAVENVGYTFLDVGGASFHANTEYFVVAAIGSTTASLYVNGQLVTTAAVTTPGPAATTTLSLGLHNDDPGYGTKRFFDGRMRDVRVYKRVLTASEVSSLYGQGPAL